MKLKTLLQEAEILEMKDPDLLVEIDHITNDSRKVTPGSVYIAIKGFHRDGHDFLAEVYNKGCRAAIVERIVPDCAIPQYRVANSRIAWSNLSAAYFGHPTRSMAVLGITSTNGKTTASFMLDEILRAAGLITGLIGTVKIRFGDELVPAWMTTPESFELQSYFAKMRDKGVQAAIMEVSSSALEQHRAHDVDFSVVSFNNFSREHIDQHGTFEKYWEAKSSIITQAKTSTITVINLDDPEIAKTRGMGEGPQITYSTDSKLGDIYLEDLKFSGNTTTYRLVVKRDIPLGERILPHQTLEIQLSIPGLHTVRNSMACAAMALAYGIAGEHIQTGLKRFGGVERRFEQIYDKEFKIFDDHFANGDNIDVTMDSLAKMDYGRLHFVYAIRGNRGLTINTENIRAMAKWLPQIRLGRFIGTETRGEVTGKDLVSPEEKQVFFQELEAAGITPEYKEDLREAIVSAIDSAKAGDIILLAGSQGMDKGGRKALEYLAQIHPEDAAEILKPLVGRICGN